MLVCSMSDRLGRAPWVWKVSSTVAAGALVLLLSYDKGTIYYLQQREGTLTWKIPLLSHHVKRCLLLNLVARSTHHDCKCSSLHNLGVCQVD